MLLVLGAAQAVFLRDWQKQREKAHTHKRVEASAVSMSASMPVAKHHQASVSGAGEKVQKKGARVQESWRIGDSGACMCGDRSVVQHTKGQTL